MNGTRNLHFLFTLLFGISTAAIGTIAVLGWILGIPVLASFSSGLIPMAPSTALLFIGLGVAASLTAQFPSNRWIFNTAIIINVAGFLIALLLFSLSSFGIFSSIEYIGFKIEGTIYGAPFGHMSPLTALGFICVELSFLITLSSELKTKRLNIAFFLASIVVLASIVLLLAHLFGTPLLYGSQFVPPALSTSL